MKSWLSYLGRAVAIAAAFVVCAPAQAAANMWQPSADDALLLELRSGTYRLGETMRGYQTPDGTCVDFADLIQAMNVPVRLDKKSRRATGWLFAEDQTFVVDRDSNREQNGNLKEIIPEGAIHDTPEGWCVDTRTLSRWFGVTFRVDLAELAVLIETDRKLPFLQAIERRNRAARLNPGAASFDLAKLPEAQTPYKSWRTPSVDVMARGAWRGGGNEGETHELQYELYSSGEVLGASFNARLASDNEGVPDSLRLRAYRNDPQGQLLGPLKATQIVGGDVETLSGALTGQTAIGRGLFISNRPLIQPTRFGVTTLRGELPAGWDAELYRNGQLYGFQSDNGNGRYEFQDVELLYGFNVLEVVTYGPQGQVRRDRTEVPVGQEGIPEGKTWYWAGILDQNRDLIDISGDASDSQTGWRWEAGIEHGLDKRTRLGFEMQSLMLDDRRRNYAEGKLQRAIGPMLVQLSGAQQFGENIGSGQAMQAQVLGKVGSISFQGEALWVNGGYESELVEANDHSQYGLRLDTALKFGSSQIPVQFAARHTLGRDGTETTELLARASMQLRRLALTAEVSDRNSNGPSASEQDDGTRVALIANTAFGPVRVRGAAKYQLSGDETGFESAEMVGDLALNTSSDIHASVEYQRDNHRTDFTLGYVHNFDRLALRADALAGTDGRIGAGLSLSFSLGRNPASGKWRVTREKLAQTGQVSVIVFRDDNGDGARDPGEEPISGVSVEAGFRHSDRATGADGRTVVVGLRPFQAVVVGIDTGSLPDPLLQPAGKGVVVVPRPGIASEIILPLAPTGEAEGTLLDANGQPREGVQLELVDARGLVVQQTLTEFDGYFLFDSVPYGQYRLRIGEMSARRIGVKAELGLPVVIGRANPTVRLGIIRMESVPPPLHVAAAIP